ncbi:MAG: D-Ala-D-Ala carboxypeptidase family metallohydrolase [Vibrio anguillarum]
MALRKKQLTKNFNLSEFHCNDGTLVPLQYLGNVIKLAEYLQKLRDKLGVPIYINSAYRTVRYNKRIGGVSSSQHIKANAVDVVAKNHSPKQVYYALLELIKEGEIPQGGIGLYRGFVHYDNRGNYARWYGSGVNSSQL